MESNVIGLVLCFTSTVKLSPNLSTYSLIALFIFCSFVLAISFCLLAPKSPESNNAFSALVADPLAICFISIVSPAAFVNLPVAKSSHISAVMFPSLDKSAVTASLNVSKNCLITVLSVVVCNTCKTFSLLVLVEIESIASLNSLPSVNISSISFSVAIDLLADSISVPCNFIFAIACVNLLSK